MKLSLIGILTLAAVGCGGTTGWVPPEENHQQGASPHSPTIGPNCNEEVIPLNWTLYHPDGTTTPICRNAVRTVCNGQFTSQTPMVPAMNENLIGQLCNSGKGTYHCVVSSGLPLVIPGEVALVKCVTNSDAGSTCGQECTGAGLYDSCTGLWGTCADSLTRCGMVPTVCHEQNICYQSNPKATTFNVECLPGESLTPGVLSFSWTDTDGVSHTCNDGTKCPSGSSCTVVNAAGVAMTGACF